MSTQSGRLTSASPRPSRYRYPPHDDDWRHVRSLLTSLYRDQKRTLEFVRTELQSKHGFRASVRMYRKRFAEWGIERKLKEHEVKYMLMMEYIRAKKGKSTSFTVHGRYIALKEIHRYAHRKRLKTSTVLEDFSKGNVRPCEWIECATPSSEIPPCTSLHAVTALENAYRHWKAMILGALQAQLCSAGETGIVWIYDDSCGYSPTDVVTAIEVFQNHRNYSRSYSDSREMFLLRKGCLLLERVMSCSNFLLWIEILQSIAYLLSTTRGNIATILLSHIRDLSNLSLSPEMPHMPFIQTLVTVPHEDFVAMTVGAYEILIDIEQALLPATPTFTWHSRIALWRFMRRHGRTAIDTAAFNLLQEGLTMYGPYTENPMTTAIVDESRWSETELKHWYSTELAKSASSSIPGKQSVGSSVEENYTAWLSYGLSGHVCNSTRGFRSFNGGDLISARKHWINGLNAPIRGDSVLSDVNMHCVLEHLDWLSIYSNVADGDVRWFLWKLVIEKDWQIELDKAEKTMRRH